MLYHRNNKCDIVKITGISEMISDAQLKFIQTNLIGGSWRKGEYLTFCTRKWLVTDYMYL